MGRGYWNCKNFGTSSTACDFFNWEGKDQIKPKSKRKNNFSMCFEHHILFEESPNDIAELEEEAKVKPRKRTRRSGKA
jgi:hypothetical protein